MCFVYFFWVPVCKFRFRLLRLLGLEQTSNTFHISCGWTNATTGSTWFHNAARSTSQSTIFMMLDFYWCCTQALSSHSIIMWHHPGMITGWCHIIIRHNCGSWRLGLLSRATTRECSNATLFQFRKSGWFKPAWSRSIWSIDAIGFCFARVMWRSMASVLDLYSFNPFFMRCIYVPLIKRSGPNFFAGPTIQTVHPWFYLVCASHEAYLLWWLLALFQLYMVAGSLLNLTLIAISKTCINYW